MQTFEVMCYGPEARGDDVLLKDLRIYFVILMLVPGVGLAQSTPSLQTLVRGMRVASLPGKPYTVNVSQTIRRANQSGRKSPLTVSSVSSFEYGYQPGLGLRIINSNSSKTISSHTTAQSTAPASQPQPANVRVTVDLKKFLSTVNRWQDTKITPAVLNGRQCYRVTAQESPFSFQLWVDSMYHYASRIVLFIRGHRFSEINITYKRVNGTYWLPSQILIHHYVDGSTVTTSFGQYLFQ